MFIHVFKNALKSLLRTKETVFWTLCFPFALSTFMYLAFSNLFETTEQFHTVSVAIVKEKENEIFTEVLASVSEGEEPLLKVTESTEEEAKRLLEDDTVKGIIYVGDDVSLTVNDSDIDQTVLQMFLNQFLRYKKTIMDAAIKNPENVEQVAQTLSEEVNCFVEKEETKGNQDNVTNYFYAIFAMVCMFASFAGCDRILTIQANTSALGQRRSVAPTHKIQVILADFLACELVQFAIVCLLFVYMNFVLKIDFGTKYLAILLLLLAGTSFGIMFGILIGSLPGLGSGGKIGILISVGMVFSVLADLVAHGLMALVEKHAPIVNDINPAALIADSFYALNIYDTYDRFFENILKLTALTVICGVVCYFMVRRNRYASI